MVTVATIWWLKVVDVASIPIGFLFSLNNNASLPQVSPPSSGRI
jgi:hypothetical protein